MLKITSRYALAAFIMAILAGGCDANNFDGAPTVHAPSAEGSAKPEASAQMPGSAGPIKGGSGEQLPPNHPPVMADGQMAGANSAPAVPMPQAAGKLSPAEFGKVGPFRWTAPDNWLAVQPASQMRLAEYHLLGADGTEPATLSVFYFGPQGGGSIQANIDRWVAQFKSIDGKPEQGVAQVSGMKVHRVAVSGTFDSGAAMSSEGMREQWRMLGAIAESPTGNYFFKLTGPVDTIKSHEAGFDAFVSSFQPAEVPG